MRAEYDFDYSKGIRAKYYKRLLKEGFQHRCIGGRCREGFSGLGGRQRSPALSHQSGTVGTRSWHPHGTPQDKSGTFQLNQ